MIVLTSDLCFNKNISVKSRIIIHYGKKELMSQGYDKAPRYHNGLSQKAVLIFYYVIQMVISSALLKGICNRDYYHSISEN